MARPCTLSCADVLLLLLVNAVCTGQRFEICRINVNLIARKNLVSEAYSINRRERRCSGAAIG